MSVSVENKINKLDNLINTCKVAIKANTTLQRKASLDGLTPKVASLQVIKDRLYRQIKVYTNDIVKLNYIKFFS